MATSATMFVEQSHHLPTASSSSVWSHMNGTGTMNDPQSYPSVGHVFDYRIKNSRPASQSSTQANVPYHITMIDGPFQQTRRQQQKIDSFEATKKLFMDKHSKKSKTSPGVIKGNTHSRNTPLQSISFLIPTPPNPSVNNSQDDIALAVANERIEMSRSRPEKIGSTDETRRHRVYFSDFNNIQIFQDVQEENEPKCSSLNDSRTTRQRHFKKYSIIPKETSGVTVPSIPINQIYENNSLRSYSRHNNLQSMQETLGRKQSFNLPIRATSLNVTQLPDIVNASIQRENIFNEIGTTKSSSNRERTIIRSKKIHIDHPNNISLDVSREPMRSRVNSSSVNDSNQRIQNPRSVDSDRNSSAAPVRRRGSLTSNSSYNNRQRQSLRAISLRQQHPAPFKMDSIHRNSTSSQNPTTVLTSLRNSARTRENRDNSSIDDTVMINNRSVRPSESARQVKRSTILHFNPKTSSSNYFNAEYRENHRHTAKSNSRKSSQERFQNLLTVVRPPMISNGSNSNVSYSEPIIPVQQAQHHPASASSRQGRRASAQGPLEFHISTNTIVI